MTAVLAQAPYVWFQQIEMRLCGMTQSWRDVDLNILFTLGVGLSALAVFDYLKKRGHLTAGLFIVAAAGLLSRLLSLEGKEGYILIIFVFYLMENQPKGVKALVLAPAAALSRARLIYYCVMSEWNKSMLLTIQLNVLGNYLGTLVPVFFYNGEKGKSGLCFQRFMYAFYPIHLLVLAGAGYLRLVYFQQ